MTKHKNIIMALVLSLIMAFNARGTLAYFSTHAETGDEATLSLIPNAELVEDNSNKNTKIVTIKNDGDMAIVANVKIFLPKVDGAKFFITIGNTTEEKSGECVYSLLIPAGESSGTITVTYEGAEDNVFEIPVVYEYAPAVYEDGKILTVEEFANIGKAGEV